MGNEVGTVNVVGQTDMSSGTKGIGSEPEGMSSGTKGIYILGQGVREMEQCKRGGGILEGGGV